MFRFKDRIVEKYAQGLLEFLEDPIKAYLFIIILRNPNITSHTIKQEMHLSGTKIFYHLKQLMQNDPPIVIESGQQKVTEHLIRRQFRISEEAKQIVREHFHQETKYFRLYSLYLSVAIQQQQIRRVKHMMKNGELPSDHSMMMFVDDEIAEELKQGIEAIFKKCSAKYEAMDRFDALQICRNAAFAGIYPLS